MSDKIFNIIIKLIKQGGADAETVRGLVDIKNAMVAGTAVIGTMVGAYYAVDKMLAATVGQFVNASLEVEKFRNETGMTAEDSSRLLTVLKNLDIGASDVETAFKFAEKNGFQPTIQSLEDMQKKYEALAPGMERTQFLVHEFGKGGLTLQKFFETGDIAQRLAEVNKNLLITEDDYGQVQKYKDELNTIGDVWTGLKQSAGKLALPVVIEVLTNLATGANNLTRGGELQEGFKRVNDQILQNSTSLADYQAQYNKFFLDAQVLTAVFATGAKPSEFYAGASEAAYEAARANAILKQELSGIVTKTHEGSLANDEMARSLAAVAATAPGLQDYFKNNANQYDFMISGAKSYDDYTQKITDQEAKLAEMRQHSWKYTAEEITGAKTALEGYIGDQTKAGEQALLDIVKKSWGDTLTPEQMATLLDMETQFGLISQSGADAYQHIWDLGQAIADIPDNKQAAFRLLVGIDGIDQAIADMMQLRDISKSAALYAYDALHGIYPNPPIGGSDNGKRKHGPQAAFGLYDFTVPPGFGNDSFPVWASSGEHVTVTPAGNQTYNYNYAGRSNGDGLERKLEQLHRDLERLPDQISTELDKRMK